MTCIPGAFHFELPSDVPRRRLADSDGRCLGMELPSQAEIAVRTVSRSACTCSLPVRAIVKRDDLKLGTFVVVSANTFPKTSKLPKLSSQRRVKNWTEVLAIPPVKATHTHTHKATKLLRPSCSKQAAPLEGFYWMLFWRSKAVN